MANENMKIPTTIQECMEILDKEMIEEDKQIIKSCEDVIDFHHTLGRSIRNLWIYPDKNHTLQKLYCGISVDADIDDPSILPHQDDVSDWIIRKFQWYLNNKEEQA